MLRSLLSLLMMLLLVALPVAAQQSTGLYVAPSTSSISNPIANSTWVFNTSGTPGMSLYSGSTNGWLLQSIPFYNLAGSGAPTVNTDSTKGYALGSLYYDTVGQALYFCQGAGTGAAVWGKVFPSSSTGTVTSVGTGTGLSGGPITSTGTISLANTAVTAGSYTNTNLTVNAQGQITSAADGTGGGGTPGGTSGQIQYNNSSSFGGFTVSGDGTINTTTGALTVTKTNGTAFAASATTDTTNASNIISGTLPAAQLPNPTASSLGGIQSYASVAHQWINTISTSGIPASTQPAFTDISGSVAASQLPNPTVSALGGVQAINAVSNEWINSINTSGVPQLSQPAFSNISGTTTAAQLPSTAVNSVGNLSPLFTSSVTAQALSFSLSSANSDTIFGNNSGSSAGPAFNTVSSYLDTFGSAQGDLLYRGASGWTVLAPGTSGYFLQTQGAAQNLVWAATSGGGGTVTSIATNNGITGGTITTTGTIGLAAIADDTVLGSVTIGSNVPVALTATQLTTIPNVATDLLQGLAPPMTDATILIGKTSHAAQAIAMSGGATMTDAGVVTLANPTATTLGGIESITSAANNWVAYITTSGVPVQSQPAFSNLSGSATLAQFPTIANNTVLGNVVGSTAVPVALTTAQHTTLVNLATASLSGAVPALTDAQIVVGKTSSNVQAVSVSGDATLADTGALTLATVNSNVGTYNNITINAKGLATAGSNVAYLTANQTITLSGDISGSGTTAITATLATVNSDTGTVGSSTSIPSVTTNAKGLVTAITGNVVVAPAGTLTGTTLNSTVVTSSLTTVGTIGTGVWQGTAINLASYATGILPTASMPALTGDVTTSSGAVATTLATVATAGTTGSSTSIPSVTINVKGLVTGVTGNAVVAPAGTLSGTTLNSAVVTSSLTTVGTIGTGVWQGTTVAIAHGGTGQTAFSTAGFVTSSGSALSAAPVTICKDMQIIGTLSNQTIILNVYAPFGYTITAVDGIQTTSGSCTAEFEIGSTPITSLSAISVTSSPQQVAATGANTVVSGNQVSLVISGVSSASGLQFTLVATRIQ